MLGDRYREQRVRLGVLIEPSQSEPVRAGPVVTGLRNVALHRAIQPAGKDVPIGRLEWMHVDLGCQNWSGKRGDRHRGGERRPLQNLAEAVGQKGNAETADRGHRWEELQEVPYSVEVDGRGNG